MSFTSLYRISFYLMLLLRHARPEHRRHRQPRSRCSSRSAVAVAGVVAFLTVDRNPQLGHLAARWPTCWRWRSIGLVLRRVTRRPEIHAARWRWGTGWSTSS